MSPSSEPVIHAAELVAVGDVELCVQSVGNPGDPVVLLVAGAASSMDWWEDDLCRAVAAGGRHVVRYDHRDTGASTTTPPGAPTYDGGALERDCLALVERLGPEPVHLVGLSMGGGIAQSIALRRPELVRTLTLVATSPAGGVDRSGLPDPVPALLATFEDPAPDPDWSDREAVVAWLAAGQADLAGGAGSDPATVRSIAGRVVDRSTDVAAAGNHWLVVEADDAEEAPEVDVHAIAAPTLVVHGSDDPLFPLEHGRALAEAVPGARLLVLDGTGHEVPPRSTWEELVPVVLEHTAR